MIGGIHEKTETVENLPGFDHHPTHFQMFEDRLSNSLCRRRKSYQKHFNHSYIAYFWISKIIILPRYSRFPASFIFT